MTNKEKMEYIEWVENECKIAIESSEEVNEKDLFAVSGNAFSNILEARSYEGDDLIMVKGILDQLFQQMPLSPLTGNDEEWDSIETDDKDSKYFVNKRYGYLYKKIDKDGNIEYTDPNRYVCLDVNNPENKYFLDGIYGHVLNMIDPIIFPYMPVGRYKLFVESHCMDPESIQNEIMGIHAIKLPNGKTIKVEKYWITDENRNVEFISKQQFLNMTDELKEVDSDD